MSFTLFLSSWNEVFINISALSIHVLSGQTNQSDISQTSLRWGILMIGWINEDKINHFLLYEFRVKGGRPTWRWWAGGASSPCLEPASINKHIHTVYTLMTEAAIKGTTCSSDPNLIIHTLTRHSFRVQYLVQGHFDMHLGGAGDRTADLPISVWLFSPPVGGFQSIMHYTLSLLALQLTEKNSVGHKIQLIMLQQPGLSSYGNSWIYN